MSHTPSPSDHWLAPLVSALKQTSARPCITGLHGSTAAFVLTSLTHAPSLASYRNRPWIVVTANNEAAERLFDDLQFCHQLIGASSDRLTLFPQWETLPYEATAPHVSLIAHRMQTLHRLQSTPETTLVTSVAALMHRLLPKDTWTHATLQLERNGTVERDTLLAKLLRLGYRRVSVVEIPGEFSIRGGLVDIFSTAYPDPLRVEFLGDSIEALRLFDASTQTSIRQIDEATILPAREYLRPEDSSDAYAPIAPDAEWRAPDLYPQMGTLFDYLPKEPILIFDQPATLQATCATLWGKIEDGYLRHGERDAANPYPSPERLFQDRKSVV